MSDRPNNNDKKIICPACGYEANHVMVSRHLVDYMIPVGKTVKIKLCCLGCGEYLSSFQGSISVTPEGVIYFSQSFPDTSWIDRYYDEPQQGGDGHD